MSRAAQAAPARRNPLAPEGVQTSSMDCGPAVLKSLLAGHGVNASYARLREACQTDVDGTSINTLESVARGSLIVAAAELASTSEVALAVLAAVLRPAVAESLRVEVALSTPLLTSAMLVFFRLSTEEVMPAAAAAEPAATVAEAESRALWSAPETASMPMPMPMPDARRRASMIQVLGRRAAHVVPRDRGSREFAQGEKSGRHKRKKKNDEVMRENLASRGTETSAEKNK